MRKLTLAILVLLLTIACPAITVTQAADAASPHYITLTWASNPATTMTITWRTDTTVSTGIVEYEQGSTLSGKPRSVNVIPSIFTTDIESTHIFTATLTGLSPDTKYSYRVGDGNHWSDISTFSTADPNTQAFKFLIFGDSQSIIDDDSYPVWRNTLHSAYSANPDARFFVNVGDLQDAGHSGAQWNCWFAAAEGVIDRIPAMPATGNHDDHNAETHRPVYWKKQFTLPENGPSRLKEQVYSYDYGQVHFVVLDSQQDEQARYGDILIAQKRWLEADLAASKAKWKIVFFHKGIYSLLNGRENTPIRDAFCPIFDRYHVDVVFNAHDHGIARTYPMKNGEIQKSTSEGTIYYTTGRSGTKSYGDAHSSPCHAFFYNPADQPNYLVAEVNNNRLTIRVLKVDGTVLDAYTIGKNAQTTTKLSVAHAHPLCPKASNYSRN